MSGDSSRKYPVKESRYYQSVGKLLPHRIGQIFQELDFVSWIAKGQLNDVDLKVFDDKDNLILVAEILNWCPYSGLSEIRKNWIITNLSKYNCKKLLIYTVLKNEDILDYFAVNGISLLKIGFQLLPKSFYDFFARKNQIESREIDSRKNKRYIKSKFEEYLQSSNIEILTSASEQIVE
jgi:hypothetical protein